MKITAASPADIDEAVACLATAFAQDPITRFLLQTSQGYRERVTQFFSLLMRARIEKAIPGLTDRMAIYDEVATKFKPPVPHYYLGVIGTDPTLQGSGIGTQLLKSFCEVSASDPLS